MINIVLFIYIILFITSITLLYVQSKIIFDVHTNSTIITTSQQNLQSKPYIKPQPFKTGYLTDKPQCNPSDLCNSKMYPVESQYVDYGTFKHCDCDTNIFNSPP
jgi:hypothetical protein